MKSSLRKLRGIAGHHRLDPKERKGGGHPRLQFDELARASQDLRDMKSCYDGLLSAAAATANCAYEFSESLGELGTSLLKRTALNDDEDSGRVLLMLGKVQFELQKLVDIYRSHVTLTISTPSESLLNELRTVEDMKRQCDGKRLTYEQMLKASRQSGNAKNSKEGFSQQQLHEAREDFDEEATLFVFRLKSLKQGQSRSLLTQAARHHSAQLNFFRKGIKLLEAIEPHVMMVAENQHIDYQFTGLQDYETGEDGDDSGHDDDTDDGVVDGSDASNTGDLSFDYGDTSDALEPNQADHGTTTEVAKEEESQPNQAWARRPQPGSQSAPIFPDKKPDPADVVGVNLQRSLTRKVNAYVLPTPLDCNLSSKAYYHSSVPLGPLDGNSTWPGQLSQPGQPGQPIHVPTPSPRLGPPPLRDTRWSQTLTLNPDPAHFEAKKLKRLAFSGPLPSPRSTFGPPPPGQTPTQLPRPPGRVGELQELPRPPPELLARPHPARHSAPLLGRARERQVRIPATSPMATPLPEPTMARSFSIPSVGPRASFEEPAQFGQRVSSPPLTPISRDKIFL
ncbi:uncharacterized protein At2g33490-like isoform X2 [Wolffia australiana]